MVMFPFPPNLRGTSYEVRREYRTDVITNRDGSEQRRALRQTPRKSVEYLAMLNADCLNEFDLAMVTAQRQTLHIPERTRFVRLTAGVSISGTMLTVDGTASWIVAGAKLVLMGAGEQELVEIDSVAGNDVTLTTGVVAAWAAGVRVHPALEGRLDAETQGNLYTYHSERGALQIAVRFDVNPASEPVDDVGTAAVTFDGREVLLIKPDHWVPVSVTRSQLRELVDYGFGLSEAFHPVDHAVRIWQASYTGCSSAAMEALRAFHDRMKGQRDEFWMPTFQRDLVLSAVAGVGTSELRVAGTAVAATFNGDPVYQAVAVLVAGTWHLNRVTGIANDAGESVLTVSDAWPVTIPEGELVSWLLLWRLASDIMIIEWRRVLDDAAVGRTQLALRSLPVPAEIVS